jgi:Fe2+ or Zn2+ uptake regulation protein
MEPVEFVASLRSNGSRVTPQKLAVLEAISRHPEHLSVHEVHERVKRIYPYIAITTVYRALQAFKDLGVVAEIAISGRQRFEFVDPASRHNHMVCGICCRVFDLEPHRLEDLRNSIEETFGFKADVAQLTITGTCIRCRSEAARLTDTHGDGNGN